MSISGDLFYAEGTGQLHCTEGVNDRAQVPQNIGYNFDLSNFYLMYFG